MGRPRLDLGTYGEIRVYELGNGIHSAETYYRGWDGKTKAVKRRGCTENEAKRSLRKALTERTNSSGGDLLTRDSYFRDAATQWLEEKVRTRRGTTVDTYRSNLKNRVLPAFGNLRLSECTTQVVHRYLRDLERTQSANHTRSCRAVVSGVLGFATQLGAIPRNPVPGAGAIEGGGKKARALTADERLDLLTRLDSDPRAARDDLPDLIRYTLGTGVRIGEACGLRWFRVDFDQGLVVHGDNLTYEIGKGLVLHEPKTPDGFRIIPVPDFVLTMLRVRYPGPGFDHAPVFPAAVTGSPAGHRLDRRQAEALIGKWRHPRNVRRSIDKWRKLNPAFSWYTSHVARKTAITIMDQEGLSPRSIAGYAGHARPSFTMDVYMDVRPQDRAASEALDRAMRPKRAPDHS